VMLAGSTRPSSRTRNRAMTCPVTPASRSATG
jgi:hypothetical protein